MMATMVGYRRRAELHCPPVASLRPVGVTQTFAWFTRSPESVRVDRRIEMSGPSQAAEISRLSRRCLVIGRTRRSNTGVMCAVVTLTLLLGPVSAQAPDAAAHKAWMNDASDAQEDYRFAVSDKNQKAATEALTKLAALMGQTEDYWTARKVADGVTLAKQSRAFASQALTAAKRGDMTAAGQSFDKLGASCNTCHELHLEKR